MAIAADIQSSTGPVATYHRIGHIRVSWESRVCAAIVVSMWNQEARDAQLGALGSAEVVRTGDDFPFSPVDLLAIREALAVPENTKLLNLDITFDKAGAYLQAAYEATVMGQRTNWQQQYPAVSKDTLPVDFLGVMYPIVQAASFSDGRQAQGAHLADGTEV